MSTYLTSQQFVRVAAVVFVVLAVAVAVIQSRRGEDAAVLAPLEPGEADALVSELARCRTITPDDAAATRSLPPHLGRESSAFLRLDEIAAVCQTCQPECACGSS